MNTIKFIPYDYQKQAYNFILKNNKCALFLDMGLGKTVITLSAIGYLIHHLKVKKVLIIAPLRVAAHTWPGELEKWDHMNGLSYSLVLGSEKERLEALNIKADIYIINRENLFWLNVCASTKTTVPKFDMIVIDELSSFKSSKSQRFKALKKMTPLASRVVGLTGTPAPNSLIDLWPQMFLLDRGERLEKTKSRFLDKYFIPAWTVNNIVYKYNLRSGADKEIHNKISDVCMSMTSVDYLNLPEKINNNIVLEFDDTMFKIYKTFEKSKVLELKDKNITAANAAVLCNKLLQFTNGAIYEPTGAVKFIHDYKIRALKEIIEASNGQNILVFYNFKFDLENLEYLLKIYQYKKLESAKDIDDWNNGKIRVLLAHPASAGHGLNLQAGGNIIVWFGLPWSLELYQQANARLYRQGQNKAVIINHILIKNTIDSDVLSALIAKDITQQSLIDAVKAKVKRYY